MRHSLTRQAERDLKDIFRYSAEMFGLRQAETYLRDLGTVFDMIDEHPRIGRPYLGRTHHFVHGRHIILYRIGAAEVVIGRIFYGAQARPNE